MPDQLTSAVLTALRAFEKEHAVSTKGSLSGVLGLARLLLEHGMPFPEEMLTTKGGGQVSKAGGAKVKRILAEYGITRRLSSEGGRTSRGTIRRSQDYVRLMNRLHSTGALGNTRRQVAQSLKAVERFWVGCVRAYLDHQRLSLNIDLSLSVSEIVGRVLAEAKRRQKSLGGAMIEGTVLQHMIGAKLSLVLGPEKVLHNPSSAADESTARAADFVIGNAALHVTTAPGDALIQRCKDNLDSSLRPIIICPSEKVAAARQLADNAGLRARIDVFAAETFISANINEIAGFEPVKLRTTAADFIARYNEIVAQQESDPSLQIEEKR